jgi:hypothetical protein
LTNIIIYCVIFIQDVSNHVETLNKTSEDEDLSFDEGLRRLLGEDYFLREKEELKLKSLVTNFLLCRIPSNVLFKGLKIIENWIKNKENYEDLIPESLSLCASNLPLQVEPFGFYFSFSYFFF